MTDHFDFNAKLLELRAHDLYREERVVEEIQGVTLTWQGKRLVHFATNDYLGLADHPQVVAAAQEALSHYGVGGRSSRLVAGTQLPHLQLERRLAQLKQGKSALLFSTGYQANLGTVPALTDHGDAIFLDRLAHASLVDACRLSHGKLMVYPHNDMTALARLLERSGGYRSRLIVTESVFSMDGDLCPLPELLDLARHYQAMLFLDEAHATGILGTGGEGAFSHWGITAPFKVKQSPVVVMGTLSKAFGSIGGFVVGDQPLIDYVRHKARAFVYTTAIPPACCAAALAAIDLSLTERWRQESLEKHNSYLRDALKPLAARGIEVGGNGVTPIVPVWLGSESRALTVAQTLLAHGFWVPAIRPPTVPKGTSRLRISLSALHTEVQLLQFTKRLKELLLV